MTEPSLWHRLNPFHHRPVSGGPPTPHYKYRSSDADDGASSVDTSVPIPSDEDIRAAAVYTPAFPSPPPKRGHARTPSVLRSLAHYPSFSALRSHSKKSRRKAMFGRAPIPAMPDQAVKDSLDIHGADDERGYEFSPSPAKYRQESNLRGVRSIPRDMRISTNASNCRPSMDRDPFHHAPSPHDLAFDFGNVAILRPKKHRREASVTSVIKRKPMPVGLSVGTGEAPAWPPRSSARVTPARDTSDITVNAMDVTPESVKMRRMRFRLDLDPNASPPSMTGLSASTTSHGSKRRDRSASTSEVIEDSPSKGRPPNIRHLSSPAPPSSFRSQYASAQHPFTTQHPHPVPLTSSPRASYDASPTFHAVPDKDDFVPLTESGRTLAFDESLQMLVTEHGLPAGTPGGTWADLRDGAFVDGSRHAKNATRFFSRDMYEPMSATPSPLSLKPLSIPSATDVANSEDRSESPFEVKLSPLVTKRMSLHAFGTAATSLSAEHVVPWTDTEELIDDHRDGQPGDGTEDMAAVEEREVPDLSTVQEGLNAQQTSGTSSCGPSSSEKTRYYTPSSAPHHSPVPPLPSRDLCAIPATRRQYSSCPPLPVTQSLLRAHGDHTKALCHELGCAKALIREMEKDLRDAKKRLEHAERSNDMEQALLIRMQELEDLLAERDQEFDDINAQIETQAHEHGLTVAQLRGALEENEGYFDTLQQAHDNLAEKLANLEAEHVDFTRDRARNLEENEEARNEVHQRRSELLRRATERSQVESVIVDLQRELHLAEDTVARQRIEHQHAVDAKVRELEATRSELVEIRGVLRARDERVAELEDLLRAGLEREGEIARLTAMLKTRDERIAELEHRQTERQRSLEERDEVVAGKDVAIAEWKHRVDEGEAEMAKLQKDLKAALQSASTKDMIIGVLRDRQRTAAYQRDEIVAAGLGERQEYEKKRQAMRQELEELRGEMGQLQGQLDQSDQAMADLRIMKSAGEDERRLLLQRLEEASAAQMELHEVRQQLQAALEQLETAQQDLNTAHGDLDELLAEDEAHVELLQQQEAELLELRAALDEAEDSAEDLGDGFLRRAQQAEEFCEELRKRIDDVREEMQARDEAVAKAMLEAEMERATSGDLRSRLSTYTSEVDRLSLANAEKKKEVEDVRRNSANGGIRLIELEKKAKTLQEDKEMLHVALESKEIELELLQRQLGRGTPASRTKSLAASTSRLTRADVTPMPARKLSKSVSHTSLRAHARAASACATPTPVTHSFSNLATPRARGFGTPSPMPLGTSSRHNQTPGPKVAAKRVTSGTPMVTPVITRRSSLPVLKGSSMDLGRSVGPEMGCVGEEDEA